MILLDVTLYLAVEWEGKRCAITSTAMPRAEAAREGNDPYAGEVCEMWSLRGWLGQEMLVVTPRDLT